MLNAPPKMVYRSTNSDQIGIDTYYEYPWLAAGSSNSMFDFYSTYPVAHVSAVSQFLYNGNEYIILKLKTNLSAQVLTPDGVKSMNISSLDSATFNVYDIETNYYDQ